ncbi:hypothetical protein TRFO_28710 [Tritrichomonas foetus]|uniref:Uncharacterized protein n=1 Tax=Tritrichomonas foetus TaxID=1144522 RepID=A0A1J4K2F9_9EUKA|nr:hypothetical protein TRFO_28710 [Tritrichomonas foetus]|eukprot:OHT03932.1 hypothetical protein TRFO_28710 [Tritrichomonas foetus]
MNGNSLRIYTIQYRIKKNKVDRHRKSTEARRLKESFDLQIQDYLYALYTSSVHIWSHINISNCNLRMNKINIKSKPNKVIEKNLSNDQNQYSFSQLVSTLKNDKSLSLNVWSDLLGQFNYLWSNESILSFCNFLSSQACDCIECFSQCFLIEPNVQKYFYLS